MEHALALPRPVAARRSLPAIAPVVATAAIAAVVHLTVPTPAPVSDASLYDIVARGLIGDPQVATTLQGLAVRGYVYPAFMAAVYAVVGWNPEAVVWIQGLVLLPLTTLLVYLAGREAFSRRVGTIAAWGFALWLPAAWHTHLLLMETLLALLLAGLVALLAALLARRTRNLALAVGFGAAVLSVAHPAYQLFWLVVPLAALAVVRQRQLITPMAIGVAAVMLPYAALVAAGAPRLGQGDTSFSGGGGGWALYVGSRSETNFTAVPSDYVVWRNQENLKRIERLERAGRIDLEPRLAAMVRRKLASPRASDRRLTDKDFYALGLEHLRANPESWPAKLRRGAAAILLVPRDPRELGTVGVTEVVWWPKIWRGLSYGLLLLALVGVAYGLARLRDRLLLFVPALAQIFVFAIVVAEPRYGIPLWPSLFLLAGLGVVLVWERVSIRVQRLQTETASRT